MMSKKRFLLEASLLAGATLACTLLAYDRLPARIPTHWNIDGVADGFGPRAMIFAFSAMMAGLAALWAVLPAVSPRRYEVDRFGPTWWRSGLLVVALFGYMQMMLLWFLLGGPVRLDRAMLGGVALLIVLLGNVLGKVRSNFWFGVRPPWTLASERVWYATHRLAGKTMVAGGLVALGLLVGGLPVRYAHVAILLGALAPAGWSLVYYKRLEREGRLGT
jgi:uncharacterized membrane protein